MTRGNFNIINERLKNIRPRDNRSCFSQLDFNTPADTLHISTLARAWKLDLESEEEYHSLDLQSYISDLEIYS